MDAKARHAKIVECAYLYKTVAETDYRFIYEDNQGTYRYVDVYFKKANFAHLVGITRSNAPTP